MARISELSLRFAFAVIAVVLISGLQLDSHLKSNRPSFGTAPVSAATAPSPDAKDDIAATARLSSSYGKLPISFEANEGQTAGMVQYLARGAGYTLFLTPGEMVLTLHASLSGARKPHGAPSPSAIMPPAVEGADKSAAVRMKLIGANKHAQALGVDPLPGKSNYLTGSDPAKWHTDIPTYAKVHYQDVYPGIDLVYYGNQEGKLEHDFVVAAGADPQQIEFNVSDRDRTPALKDGELRVHTRAGDLNLQAPEAFQVIGGERRPVAATYEAASSGAIGFRVGSYDRHYPLIIDPVLAYTAVFGGSQNENLTAIAVDTAGNAYVTGLTFSSDFPVVNQYQSAPSDISEPTASAIFVSKLNSSGTALLYSTYLGGGGGFPEAIAVDSSGRTYVSGQTSGALPVKNAYQPTFAGGYLDAFVSVLTPSGNALEWSTYLGGPEFDYGSAMALDPFGNVYVSGGTHGSFPALDSIFPQGTPGVWVAKFNSAGVLQYSSIVSRDPWAEALAMATDSKGSAYIAGSTSYPETTPGAFRSTCWAQQYVGNCAWVAKLNPAGDSLVYATTLGVGPAGASAIAVDSDLNAYVAGATGPGLTVWSTGFQRTYGGGSDGFVMKLNATGSNLIWSTYLGGSGDDYIRSLALDRYRQVYVSGFTCSPNFPLKASIQTFAGCPGGNPQAFVTTLSSSLNSIQYYSTYLGGAGSYEAEIAVDPALNVYVAGNAFNNVHPTPGAYSVGSAASPFNIYISKLSIMDDLALAVSASPTPVVQGSNLTYTMAVTSKGPDFGVNVRVSDTLPAGTTFVSYDAGGGTCTAPPVGSTGTLNCVLPQLNKGATWNVKLTVHVNAASGTTLSNTAATISNMQDFVIGNNSATTTTQVY